MLAGHYAASFAARAVQPKLPLWMLFVAAQLVDIFWAVFVLTGIERASLDPGLPSNPLIADYMPYTHSLVGTAVVAAVVWLALLRPLGPRGCTLVALVVLSHWFLDLIMHRHDLTIAGWPPKVGYALWDYASIAHPFELALLVLSVVLFRQTRTNWILLGTLVALQLYSIYGPLPATVTGLTLSLLVLWLALPAVAFYLERGESEVERRENAVT